MWTKKLLDIAKQTIPNKLVTVRPNDKPWFNNVLRHLLRKKTRAYNYAKSVDTLNAWDKFKKIRNEYVNLISTTKKLMIKPSILTLPLKIIQIKSGGL